MAYWQQNLLMPTHTHTQQILKPRYKLETVHILSNQEKMCKFGQIHWEIQAWRTGGAFVVLFPVSWETIIKLAKHYKYKHYKYKHFPIFYSSGQAIADLYISFFPNPLKTLAARLVVR